MDVSHILYPLNDAQREAVAADAGNILVLAGAGSGKTRVLIHRIAWYIQTGQATAGSILAVTFTNKAAGEMRGRLEKILGHSVGAMWVGTFHGIAHRVLRAHWRDANLDQNFQIMDSDDQYRMIRRLMRGMEIDESKWPPREVQWFISGSKDEGLRPQHLKSDGDFHTEQMIHIYRAYEEVCTRSGLVDFAELLLRTFEIFRDNEALRRHYQDRFRHVLVDEFQDTNTIQYSWLKLLSGKQSSMFVVGDDDQSIYSWRGAQIENMQRFQNEFVDTTLVRLEQNYRSTANILAASNALIGNNTGRIGKELWTDGEEGDPIPIYTAYNEQEEARYIIEQVMDWQQQGHRYDQAAVLYRTSAQSRVFEDHLRRNAIPYRVHGGFRFYERAEVKDALAYMRLAAFRNDDTAFERIINTPTRGIGNRSVETVREQARRENTSLWKAMADIVLHKTMSGRAVNAFSSFINLIEAMAQEIEGNDLHEVLDNVIKMSGLIAHYKKDTSGKAEDRIENLEELVTAAQEFEAPQTDDDEPQLDPLSEFLAHAALEAGEGQADVYEDSLQLMTLHAAKGLEYPLIFLTGLEEGLFPHQRSRQDINQLEEERRLCYVGMTRAMEKLVLTHAEVRRIHGQETYPQPSRFIREIPGELISSVRFGNNEPSISSSEFSDEEPHEDRLGLGRRVYHDTFGEGVILNMEGQGSHTRVQVNFEQAGSKWLVAAYANLQTV
ncbi:MAG: DNA helicase II [Gammaproteobacteria bacterium]